MPLDGDKGVFTSHIHLLDELSVQSLAADILKDNRVVNFSLTGSPTPGHLEHVAREPAIIINAPASVGRLREVTEELVTMSREQGREVSVLTSSAERALSFAKSPELKDRLLHRSRMLNGTFSLTPQSTVIVESAEKLSLKEMLILTGEAQLQNAQLLFLDSAGRQSNANALSVLTAAGVKRQSLNTSPDGIEVRVTSIQAKRDRYQALAECFAGMDPADGPVTAVVTGPREQAQLTGVIRNALQNAGRLGQEQVSIVARTPVFMTAKERRLPQTYRAGMVLEDRSEKNETRHYVIDRVHDETRMLSVVDGDGVLSRIKLSSLSGDWRLFKQSEVEVAAGEQLFALAGDKNAGLKARDRLTVTAIENGTLVVQREGQKKPLQLDASGPLYVSYGYVSAPGSRDNDHGTVLASLGAQDLSVNMINALAQSGHEAEIFTGEDLSRAEEKLGRMRSTRSPLSLVRQASGKEDASEAVDTLNRQLLSDARKAVTRSVAQMRDVAFPWTKLLEEALGPTHRAVKEMAGTGIDAQTLKSFVLDWQMRTAAGEDVRYDNMLFLIDESSMIGNQDTAAAYRAIAAGNGRAVPVGDVAQLQSPESGAPFQLMQERSPIDVAVMKEIVRQRDTDLKSAVYSIIGNDFAGALRNIEKVSPDVVPRRPGTVLPSGSIVQSADPVSTIVADFMSRTDEAREQTMIMVQLHADRKAINEGIHEAMVITKELGEAHRIVPVLDRINGGRHDFNRIDDWEAGQVVMANQRYLHVTGVDQDNGNVILKDEAGRTHFWSPQELNATEIEVFETRAIELRTGDSVRLSKTQKQAGHAAHEQYRVEELRDTGEIVLRNGSGVKVIDPATTIADRHVDYSWAVTGYGAQGASARYSLALEGVEGARKQMSGARAFYINVSRAKDHVQIVTDDKAGWTKTLRTGKDGATTAHDALMPEPERVQARQIWAMGQAASKTAIGRAFLRSNGLSGSPVTARIIPPTRKFPEPHLALPVYDGNGKAAGLTMVPLRPGSGEVSRGTERRIITTGGQAALLQKSRNGETLVVNTLDEALSTARKHPTSGILLKTGDDSPSQQLLKISGGLEPVAETVVRAAVNSVQNTPPVPEDTVSTAVPADIGDAAVRNLVRRDSHQPDVPVVPEAQIMARDSRADVAGEEKLATDLSRAIPQEMTHSEKPEVPVAKSVTDEAKLAGRVLEETRQDTPGINRMPDESREQPVHSGKGDTELATELSAAARTEKEIAAGLSRPVQHDAPERMPPELSHASSRNIQKER
ncbi:conjugative transfer relaxase/helicase TraI domain-containing protein [Pantoea agglomerans]|uniref:conjugative transfer relaxase/helicase TraI domain-containing protein n=1 Tax=Enterobacter agglomerans TaxID=549 RepID=UPI001EE81F8E|nr:conjugative transfer relaxase/helicase TraI domain-containing protein [Pantoea agglomerans]